jgi:hypothetical protein
MLSLYRCLLCLYPTAYRREYGDEMAGVFRELLNDVPTEIRGKGSLPRGALLLREFAGLLCGALEEHSRAIAGSHLSFPSRRSKCIPDFAFRRPRQC